jgi:predicted alpha/beta-hydrolase family hydrolase
MPNPKHLHFQAVEGREVSALLLTPKNAKFLLVLAHGAGASMTHPFMQSLSEALAAQSIATFRYNFPYMEEARRIPDRPPTLTATVAAAVNTAANLAPNLPIFAGGKSLGARMTSQGAAQNLLSTTRGLIFFGFPLHPPNRPDTKRATHLDDVTLPMLFLQGTRDTLADLSLLRPIVKKLAKHATLHTIDTADHSFHVLKSAKKSDSEVLQELTATTAAWMEENVSRSGSNFKSPDVAGGEK